MAGRGRSRPRAAATIQLADRARLSCHWSWQGWTASPLVQAVEGGGGKAERATLLDRSRGSGAGAGARAPFLQGFLAPSTPRRASHSTPEKDQSLCTPIPKETAPWYLREASVSEICRKASGSPHLVGD